MKTFLDSVLVKQTVCGCAVVMFASVSPVHAAEADKEIVLEGVPCCVANPADVPAGAVRLRVAPPDADSEAALRAVLDHTGLQPNFAILSTRDIGYNAISTIQGGRRLVLYSPDLFADIRKQTGVRWAATAILAHEIGHHLQGHTLESVGSRPKTELEADRFSGYVMARMGAGLDDSTAPIKKIANEDGSESHPPRYARVAAITDGWQRARAHMVEQKAAMPIEAVQAKFLRLTNTAEAVTPTIWSWRVCVDADAATLARIKSVEYHLHPTLDEPVRVQTSRESNFAVSDKSRGSFPVKAVVTFNDGTTDTLRHELKLGK